MKTILYAEDNKVFRTICKRILEEEGYHVILACNGMEAVAAVREQSPDVAILDVHMPFKNGLEAAELIFAIKPNLPIIFYTANDDICTRDSRARFGVACVEKSSDFTELAIAVLRVLHMGPLRDDFRFGLNPLPKDPARKQISA
jgi:CheY-like chemotaxis protein